PNATPFPFSFQTVDDSLYAANSVQTINDAGEIAGDFGNSPNSWTGSYTAVAPYSLFGLLQYPATATVATSLSNSATPAVAGYMVGPPQLRGTWVFCINNGVWAIFKDRKEGKNSYAVTQLLGLNDSDFGAGFYVNPYGVNVPVVINMATERFTVLKPPGMIAGEATGINNMSHIVGWDTTANGTTGFFLKAGTYYTISYPQAAATEVTSVNTNDLVSGYYTDSNGVNHGFILTSPTGGSQQTWQTVDEPNAAHGTVITHINDNDDISGYYFDANNVQHGFVAVP
ncbi:MAG TPA: hypothetical protein VEW74_02570, partial [Candidatus Nitrosotalea sp.]|nr:hypothetical protein [Candidatus Nitrosotalea sp.]